MDWTAFRDAARRGMRPGRPLEDPVKLMRLAVGMLVATIVGYLLHDPQQQLLITIGAFLATIAVVMPHNRSRLVAVSATSVAQIVAAGLGLLCSARWPIVFPVIFVLFLIAGMLRAVAIGISVRLTVITIVFLAFAEISPGITNRPGAVALFAVGFAIMNLTQLLPPYSSRYSAQRRAVAGFYRAVAAGAAESSALLAADRSLALLRWRHHHELDRLAQLVARGEEIAQLLRALDNHVDGAESATVWRAAAARQLLVTATLISSRQGLTGSVGRAAWPGEPHDDLHRALVRAMDTTTRLAVDQRVPPPSDERHTPSSVELVRDELRWGSPVLRHAIRLAVVCVVAQAVGLAVSAWLGSADILAGHSFWVVVAAALIVFPDYGSTFARGIGRSIGTVAGAVVGIALSFLPAAPLTHSIVLLLLFYGYLAFRSCGQPFTMFWVVAWISSLTPGTLGATTRGLDTVIGCVLAFLAYLIAPTWQRRLLTERLREWAEATANHIDALVLLWAADDETHRLTVSHATVRARLTRLEFTASAQSARLEPRDKHGRWENDALDPAMEAVTNAGQQIAALSALAPLWDHAARADASATAEEVSRDLTVLAQDPAGWSDRGLASHHVSSISSSTNATLDRLQQAVANLSLIVARPTKGAQ